MIYMPGECATCVALLHDLVEDHKDKYDFDYLIKEGFPLEVVNILRLLTHEKEVPYMEYIKSISKNQIAREVKIQDLKHNINIIKKMAKENEQNGWYKE